MVLPNFCFKRKVKKSKEQYIKRSRIEGFCQSLKKKNFSQELPDYSTPITRAKRATLTAKP
jgi:hypothetical protein